MKRFFRAAAITVVAIGCAVPAWAQVSQPGLDPTAAAAIKTLSVAALGYIWQWARAPQKWPNYVTWIGFSVAAVALYAWQTPDIRHEPWQLALLNLFNFVMTARGIATTSKDVKLAPATDSKT